MPQRQLPWMARQLTQKLGTLQSLPAQAAALSLPAAASHRVSGIAATMQCMRQVFRVLCCSSDACNTKPCAGEGLRSADAATRHTFSTGGLCCAVGPLVLISGLTRSCHADMIGVLQLAMSSSCLSHQYVTNGLLPWCRARGGDGGHRPSAHSRGACAGASCGQTPGRPAHTRSRRWRRCAGSDGSFCLASFCEHHLQHQTPGHPAHTRSRRWRRRAC